MKSNCFLVKNCLKFPQFLLFHNSAISSKGAFPFYNKHKKVTNPNCQDFDYFEKEAEKLNLDENYLDNLKLLWEEKIGSSRELLLKSTDLLIGNNKNYALPNIDTNAPRIEYQKIDLLKDAPDSVKKIFSISFGERKDLTTAWKRALIEKVNIYELNEQSLQSRIAWATACIRHYTALVDELISRHKQNKKPKWLLHRIFLLVGWRQKLLRKLRNNDFNEFNRVLKELKLVYHVPRDPEHVNTRKAWSEHQLRRRCEMEKENQLNMLRQTLEKDRVERKICIDKELVLLETEKQKIKKQLKEISELEGKSVKNCVGKYEPKLVEEFSEIMLHSILFYHPAPQKQSFNITI